ncbi:hypothetical protein PYX05_27685 [Klebsiella pneumoniae]|nr:hypothetical protein [Klebsiella pneumoniae]
MDCDGDAVLLLVVQKR